MHSEPTTPLNEWLFRWRRCIYCNLYYRTSSIIGSGGERRRTDRVGCGSTTLPLYILPTTYSYTQTHTHTRARMHGSRRRRRDIGLEIVHTLSTLAHIHSVPWCGSWATRVRCGSACRLLTLLRYVTDQCEKQGQREQASAIDNGSLLTIERTFFGIERRGEGGEWKGALSKRGTLFNAGFSGSALCRFY